MNFHNVPLRQAIDDLRSMTKMNIHLETEALAAEAINPETPVSLEGDLTLKSALKLMLDQAHLTYVIRDEMLKITTPRAAQGKQERQVYSVADLVIPIDDYILPDEANIQPGDGAGQRVRKDQPQRRPAEDQSDEHAPERRADRLRLGSNSMTTCRAAKHR